MSYNALIDLIALIPSIIEWSSSTSSTSSSLSGSQGSALRLWRVVRIMKIEHYSNAFATLKGGFSGKQKELWKLVIIYPIVGLIIFATLLSYTETLDNGATYETSVYFTSIPRAMFPTLLMLAGEAPLIDFTAEGQIIVSVLSVFSLVIMATATGILASGFESAMRETKEASIVLEQTRRILRHHIKKEAKNQRTSARELYRQKERERELSLVAAATATSSESESSEEEENHQIIEI